MTKKDEGSKLIKLSASSIKTYEQCPRRYKFSYIDRAPKKRWEHFDLGNICHKTLEIFHSLYMKDGLLNHKTLGALMGHSFSEARKEFKDVGDKILIEAKEIITDYLGMVKSKGMPIVKGVEVPFEMELNNNILMRGFVDRVDVLKDGRFEIMDYKTTKNEKYLDSFQLLVYGIWLKKEYKNINSFKAAYVLLKHKSKLKEFDFNMNDIEKAEKKIFKFSEEIKNNTKWETIPTMLCDWCDFKDICPAHKW